MSASPDTHQGPSAWRRFANSRWFQVFVAMVILAVSVYLSEVRNRGQGFGNRPAAPPRANKSWAPFTWQEAGVEVEMPERPVRQEVSISVGDRRIPAIAYASNKGRTTFSVAHAKYPDDIPLPTDQDDLLAKGVEWLTAQGSEPDDTVDTIDYRGHVGVQALRRTFTRDGRRVRSWNRLFMSGRRALILGAVGDIADFDEEGASRFFDSLRFKGNNEDSN